MIINNKKILTFREQIQKQLVPPDVYNYIPSSITGDSNIQNYTGVSINTYYKDSTEYINIGRNYLKFKSIVLQTNSIPSEGSIDQDSISTISGFDESVSAIRNYATLFNTNDKKYLEYLIYINDYLSSQTNGLVDSFQEFYRQNSSFITNTDLTYIDSIHVFTITNKFFKFSSLVDVIDNNFTLLKLDQFNLKLGSTLKYNIINDLKFRDIIGFDDSKIEIKAGVVYEDGTIIIAAPFITNSDTLSSTVIKSTCLGTLSGSEVYEYNFNYASTGSVTSTIYSYQKVLKTVDSGNNFSTLLSGTSFPQALVKDFADSISSASARIENSAFTDETATGHTVNWAITGALTAGFVLVRSTSDITFAPTDGIEYSVTSDPGDGSLIVYVGSSYSASSTGLTAGTLYNYALIPYNGSGANTNYYSPVLNFSGAVLATIPTADPTSLTATGINSLTATISFVAASPTAERYFVTYRTGTDCVDDPDDGSGYNDGAGVAGSGDLLTNDRVCWTGSVTAFTFSNLSPQTNYYLRALSYNGTDSAAHYYTGGTPAAHDFWTLSTKPVSYPTNFTVTSRTANSIAFTYNAASPTVSGYISMQKAGSLPNPTLASGTAYGDGDPLSDSSISISSITSLSVSSGSLSPDTQYYFKVVAYNQLTSTPETTNYLTTNTLTGTTWTLAAIPTAAPTSFNVTGRNTTTANIAWTASSPTSERYFILYRSAASVTSTPTNGQSYNTGALITGSTVDFVGYTGSAVSFNLSGLSPGTQYYLRGLSYNGQPRSGTTGSQHFYTAAALTGTFYTLTSEPSALSQPGGFLLTSKTHNQIVYSYSNGSPVPSGYINLRKASSAPNLALVIDGNEYSDGSDLGSGTISVSSTTAVSSITNSSLSPKTQYYFTVCSYNRVSSVGNTTNYKTDTGTLTASIWTLDTEPGAQPTSPVVSGRNTTTANLAWTAAASVTGYLALVKTSAISDAPTDADFYSVGNTIGSSTVGIVTTGVNGNISGLTQQTQYNFALFSYNQGADNSTTNYLTSSPLTGTFYTLSPKPTAPAISLTATGISTTQMTITYGIGTPSSTGFMTLRHTALPNPTIADGTTYSDGSSMSDSSVSVSSITGSSATSVVVESLSPGTLYYFKVVTYNQLNTGAAASTINYYTAQTLTSSFYTLKAEPSSSPSSINLVSASSRSTSSISASFTKNGDGTLFLVRAGQYATTDPTDAVYYSAGTAIGNGTVSFTGSGQTNISLSGGLVANTVYNFLAYSYNEPNINYRTSSPLQWTCRTLATKPTVSPSITGVSSVSTTSAQINVSNVSNDGDGYMYAYKVGSDFTSEVPVDGQYYSASDTFGAGFIIGLTGNNQGITYSSTATDTIIYIRAYSRKGTNGASLTATSNAFLTTTISTTGFYLQATQPNNCTFLNYSPAVSWITLSWDAPSGAYNGFVLVKKSGSPALTDFAGYPVNNTTYIVGDSITADESVLYVGSDLSKIDGLVTDGGRYRYMIVPFKTNGDKITYSDSSGVQKLYIPTLILA